MQKLYGKLPPNNNPKLQLARYKLSADPVLHDFPCSWLPTTPIDWMSLGNNSVGDCTCAAALHMIMSWTAFAGHPATFTRQDALNAYSAITGYNPQTGANDNGAVESDVLKYWQTTGFAGHKIACWAQVNPQDIQGVKEALYWFQGLYIGLSMPQSAQGQTIWDVPTTGTQSGPGVGGSWGGHAVPILAADTTGLTVISWGVAVKMTWGFLSAYCDEMYAVLSTDVLSSQNLSANHFNITQLMADIQTV